MVVWPPVREVTFANRAGEDPCRLIVPPFPLVHGSIEYASLHVAVRVHEQNRQMRTQSSGDRDCLFCRTARALFSLFRPAACSRLRSSGVPDWDGLKARVQQSDRTLVSIASRIASAALARAATSISDGIPPIHLQHSTQLSSSAVRFQFCSLREAPEGRSSFPQLQSQTARCMGSISS